MRLSRAIERVRNRISYLNDIANQRCPMCQRKTLVIEKGDDPRTSPKWHCIVCPETGFICNGSMLVDSGDIEVLAVDKEALDMLAENALSDAAREAKQAYLDAIHAVRVTAAGGPWVLRVICQHCKTLIREQETDQDPHGHVSHGICMECGPKFYPDVWPEVLEALAEREAV